MKQVETTRTRTNRWTISLNGPRKAKNIEQHRFRLDFLSRKGFIVQVYSIYRFLAPTMRIEHAWDVAHPNRNLSIYWRYV